MLRYLPVSAAFVATLMATPDTAAAKAPGKARTYKAEECRPKPAGWQKQGSEFGELMIYNLATLRRNHVIWNGSAVSDATFTRYLSEARRLNPRPNIVLVVDDLSTCARVSFVRHAIEAGSRCGVEHACVQYSSAEWQKTRPPQRRQHVG